MFRIYSFTAFIALFCLPIVALFSKKTRLFLRTRKSHGYLIQNKNFPSHQKLIWFHCASLGEFELCKPLIKKIKSNYPTFYLLLTFFSPSGIQTSNDLDLIDCIGFLPFDTKKNVQGFLNKTNPIVAIFIKYEFWPHYLKELHQRQIVTFAISSRFYPNHFLFQWYGNWLLKELKKLNHVFVQNQSSFDLLKKHQFKNVSVSGDLRIDRVIENASHPFHHRVIEAFLNNQTCFIAGSTWESDIELLFPEIESTFHKIIIAPHDVGSKTIAFLESNISVSYQKMSSSDIHSISETQILIADSIGLLSSIYRFAQITYVGGGFSKKGLHNILEPIAYSKPVLFGPHYHLFPEAVDLVQKQIAFSVSDKFKLKQTIEDLLKNPNRLSIIENQIQEYLNEHKNGTKKVFEKISNYLKS
ncbi:MAG: 3-deoxy-D-manno-octulosonic acid transferase [Flavobacteriaceae bacterium]|nr:3-deoxy-D-manno-octulosonic acid transferase [Flavobacteriaceae bacterium]MCY4268496.1 3-deoxy-D-manno-octulosonic acid transferase [Flavobacteriaceae bacterium]